MPYAAGLTQPVTNVKSHDSRIPDPTTESIIASSSNDSRLHSLISREQQLSTAQNIDTNKPRAMKLCDYGRIALSTLIASNLLLGGKVQVSENLNRLSRKEGNRCSSQISFFLCSTGQRCLLGITFSLFYRDP